MNQNTVALEFADRVGNENDPASVGLLFGHFISGFGFNCFSAGRVASERRRVLGGRVWMVSPHKWYDHWTSQRYAKLDPIVWYWRNHPSRRFAAWSEIKAGNCGPRPEIFDEAQAFGIKEGLAVGIKMAQGDFATVAMGTEEQRVTAEAKVALGFAAMVCAARLAELGDDVEGVVSADLTIRQRECLTWAATGKSDWEISQILGLSHRTVQEHIGRCVKKLRAANRAHAIVLALLQNYITP